MVMAGVMERHPGLRVLLAHGGGAVLALRGRLRHAHGVPAAGAARLREPPDDSLRRFHYDTITHDPALLRALVDFAGRGPRAARLRLSVRHGRRAPRRHRPRARARAGGEAAILGGNAERLLGLERHAERRLIG